jgi:hypothetical protein
MCAIVMPVAGFVQLVGFFDNNLKTLIKNNVLTQAQADELLALNRDDPR